ncbi:hypothetical protein CYMTET_47924 [Cymbomonas tetramitiformis]|uniref:Uncharacterized protein n=1 Tax=Cymbomonas tetramitiformis TaxID=36881 RepID=A0AAE0BTB7_9CHLO|nr:hypothetical protein CYMTET_47924 [Cymbomonas tetramitiformis]
MKLTPCTSVEDLQERNTRLKLQAVYINSGLLELTGEVARLYFRPAGADGGGGASLFQAVSAMQVHFTSCNPDPMRSEHGLVLSALLDSHDIELQAY